MSTKTPLKLKNKGFLAVFLEVFTWLLQKRNTFCNLLVDFLKVTKELQNYYKILKVFITFL